jgi:hypothetical protein
MSKSDESGSQTMKFDALWIFKEEIKKAGFIAELEAHTSQPIGLPLHKHHGHIEVDDTSVVLTEGDSRKLIQKSEITGLQVSYDDDFQRIRDSRGMIPPMHFSFGDDAAYIFTKGTRFGFWQGENTALSEAIIGH